MKLSKILKEVDYSLIQGTLDIDIMDIHYNSKLVKDKSIFICMSGAKLDGHIYIDSAIENGANTIIVEREIEGLDKNITVIKVKDTKIILPIISKNFYDDPSSKFKLIGITGTNGKTTVSKFIDIVLKNLGHKVGVIGTIGTTMDNEDIDLGITKLTTPQSKDLQHIFNIMYEKGAHDVIMECSSMGIEMHRVDKCDFDIAVFTNLTQDHLDDHKTMENYKNAKLKLFYMCKKSVINIDDEFGGEIIGKIDTPYFTYAIDREADLRATDINITSKGVRFKIILKGTKREVYLKIPGKFSIYNALATIGTCYNLGYDIDSIIEGICKIEGVKGRFQLVSNSKGCTTIVDYAHTPDALENVIKTAKEFARGKVITVFGCGGNRDKTKRPIMAYIASINSDFLVITSDNPRDEDPEEILNDVESGISSGNKNYIKITDRREAIHYAMDIAKVNDIIIIAGKGHENYQIINGKTHHFDDVEVVEEYR
ncbi:MAG: UDP-N-acetylmuramoyl-L-alanyl-D-glutamate--2,6-diaminopimelate ligase [Clostridium sp.]